MKSSLVTACVALLFAGCHGTTARPGPELAALDAGLGARCGVLGQQQISSDDGSNFPQDGCVDASQAAHQEFLLTLDDDQAARLWTFRASSGAVTLAAGDTVDGGMPITCTSYTVAPNGQYLLRDGGTTPELKLFLPVREGPATFELSATASPMEGAVPFQLEAETLLVQRFTSSSYGDSTQLFGADMFMGYEIDARSGRPVRPAPFQQVFGPIVTSPARATVTMDSLPGYAVQVTLMDPHGQVLGSVVAHGPGVLFSADVTPPALTDYPNNYELVVDNTPGVAASQGCPYGGWMAEPNGDAVLPLQLHLDLAPQAAP